MESDDAIKIALAWYLHNTCTSNVELARITNVCRCWREVAVKAVVSEAILLATTTKTITAENFKFMSSSTLALSIDEVSAHNASSSSSSSSSTTLFLGCIRRLLIVDMAREMMERRHRQCFNEHHNETDTSSSEKCDTKQDIEQANIINDGNFCLAWFAPSGIQTLSVSLESDAKDDKKSSATNTKSRRGRKVNRGKSVTCCPEWRGYRHPHEILIPFGYSADFIQKVFIALQQSQDCAIFRNTETISTTYCEKKVKVLSQEYTPTYAVRGATLARPEGYCFCVDNKNNCRKQQQSLEKVLLPRLILSTRRKSPVLHRFAETDGNNDKHNKHEQHTLPWEKRQRAIQFLNSDKSQAVKFITPPFACGPTHGPITMFIVGIMTEDGCFISGRSSRFDFGHLFPLSSQDMLIDMSPIAIATEKWRKTKKRDRVKDEESSCQCIFNSDDPFNPNNNYCVQDPTEDCIHRGRTGPGLWHCYTAVFDGKDSLIRLDGCGEQQCTRKHYGLVTSDEEDNIDDDYDADNVANASRFVGSGTLDGLTIGSDHQFDMSLCCGGDVDGECGQGAISEIAIFKGRMDIADIVKLEQYLMKKHGILSTEEMNNFIDGENSNRLKPIDINCQVKEDEWRRQAHAMMEQSLPWNVEGPIPLRVATNHHSVAWRRTNEITGSTINIQRIGTKHGTGSSDW